MNILFQCIFWMCLFVVVYTYLLYPVLLAVMWVGAQVKRDLRYLGGRRNRRSSFLTEPELPRVTMLIPAYNEQGHLPDKIANLKELDYPADKLQIIFISDGSSDGTNELLSSVKQSNVEVLVLPERGGKPSALNHGVARARHEILVFSDAATLFAPDALQTLVRHFAHPEVGAVCGSLRFQGSKESQQTEGVYWGYESMLRLMESRLGATLTASGAIFALRRLCYAPLEADTVIEDFVIPMNARRLGFRVLYDPEAVATEFAAPTVAGEFRRRVRLAIGSFRNLGNLLRVPLRTFTRVAFISHKVLRWMVPFLLIGILASNCLLYTSHFYRMILLGQVLFYLWAALGFAFREQMQKVRYGLVGYFLLLMNLALLVGFFRFVFGKYGATWEHARS